MILKRLFLVFASSLVLAAALGCTTPYIAPVVTADDGSIVDDFYFICEEGEWFDVELWDPQQNPDIFLVRLDTKNNIIGKSGYYEHGYVCTDYYMPQDRLQGLYDDIIRYDIKSYSSPDLISVLRNPNRQYYLRYTFRINGEVYSILTDSSIYSYLFPEELNNLYEFTNNVFLDYYIDTDEYRSFPESAGYY